MNLKKENRKESLKNYLYSEQEVQIIEEIKKLFDHASVYDNYYIDENGKQVLFAVECNDHNKHVVYTFIVCIPPKGVLDKSIYSYMHNWSFFLIPTEKNKLNFSLEEYQRVKFWEGENWFFCTFSDLPKLAEESKNYDFLSDWKKHKDNNRQIKWRNNGEEKLYSLPLAEIEDWLKTKTYMPQHFPPIQNWSRWRREPVGKDQSSNFSHNYFTDAQNRLRRCYEFYIIAEKDRYTPVPPENIFAYPEEIEKFAYLREKECHKLALDRWNVTLDDLLEAGYYEYYAKELLGTKTDSEKKIEELEDWLSLKRFYTFVKKNKIIEVEETGEETEENSYFSLHDRLQEVKKSGEKIDQIFLNGKEIKKKITLL